MAKTFDEILDECIDRISRGEKLGDCLTSYPEQAEALKPLLQAVLNAQRAYTFVPSPAARRAARQRFNAAFEELRGREAKRPFFPWPMGWAKVWVPVAAVLLVALIGYFALKPAVVPVVPGPGPNPEGNFVFLMSDEVNAIGDFQSLNISISKIGLSDGNRWIEIDPEVTVVDLTLLPGDKTQQIWRGDIPGGQYSKVFIEVSNVTGVLKENGRQVDVKLPSEKLQIAKSFQVTSGSVTSFVYDVTVVAAGNPQSPKYILKPQVDQSGADLKPIESKGKGKK